MPQNISLHDECRRVSAELDLVMADMENGRPSQSRHDGHVDQVVGLATRLLSAARGPGRSDNPPLAKVGSGYLW